MDDRRLEGPEDDEEPAVWPGQLTVVWRFHCDLETGGPWSIEVHELIGRLGDEYYYVNWGDSGDGVPVELGRFDNDLAAIEAGLEVAHYSEWERESMWERSEEGGWELRNLQYELGWEAMRERLGDVDLTGYLDRVSVLHLRERCLRGLQAAPMERVRTTIADLVDDVAVRGCRTCLPDLDLLVETVREIDAEVGADIGDSEPPDELIGIDWVDHADWDSVVRYPVARTDIETTRNALAEMVGRWTDLDTIHRPRVMAAKVPPQASALIERVLERADERGIDLTMAIEPLFTFDAELTPNGLPRRLGGGFVEERATKDGNPSWQPRARSCSQPAARWRI